MVHHSSIYHDFADSADSISGKNAIRHLGEISSFKRSWLSNTSDLHKSIRSTDKTYTKTKIAF